MLLSDVHGNSGGSSRRRNNRSKIIPDDWGEKVSFSPFRLHDSLMVTLTIIVLRSTVKVKEGIRFESSLSNQIL